MALLVEICADGAGSAFAAEEGGADRVELCEDLSVGGVTPRDSVLEEVCSRLRTPVRVLIRPRPGDFVYGRDDVRDMLRGVERARASGASGVVLGVNTRWGRVDIPRVRELMAAARPLGVTFHKAIDELDDPSKAVEDLVELGVDRVLTSGRAGTAREGASVLGELVRIAGGRLTILAGGRIVASDLPTLAGVGLREVHLGSGVQTGGSTDADKVRRLVILARSLGSEGTSGA